MKTAVYGIVALCLLLMIENDNLKSVATKVIKLAKHEDSLHYALCCMMRCNKGDICVQIGSNNRWGNCKCYRKDNL